MSQPRFEIVQEDMGGWVRVFLGRGEPTGELSKYLSHGLTDWMRKRLICGFDSPSPSTVMATWQNFTLGTSKCCSRIRSPMADPKAGGAES